MCFKYQDQIELDSFPFLLLYFFKCFFLKKKIFAGQHFILIKSRLVRCVNRVGNLFVKDMRRRKMAAIYQISNSFIFFND